MDKLEKLTAEQEAMIPIYRDRWIANGLSSGPTDRKMAEKALDDVYICGGLTPPKMKIWVSSPFAGPIACFILQNMGIQKGEESKIMDQVLEQIWNQAREQIGEQTGGQVGALVREQVGGHVGQRVGGQVAGQVVGQVWNQVEERVWAQVVGQVWNQVRDQVVALVRKQVGGQVGQRVGEQVLDQVGEQVRAQVVGQVAGQVVGQVDERVWNQLRNQVEEQVWNQVAGQVAGQVGGQAEPRASDKIRDRVLEFHNQYKLYGIHDSGWISWLAFFDEVVGLKGIEKARGLFSLAKHSGWVWCFRDIAVMTEIPTELHKNENGLHSESGMAIKYSDGWGFWSLNGQVVPQWLAETPAEHLDPAKIMALENVDQRREGVRKIGVSRMLDKLGAKSIHKDTIRLDGGARHDYELVEFSLPGASAPSRALKMKNPSVADLFHVETVWPGCSTVMEALAFRATGKTDKKALSEYTLPVVLT